MYEPSLWFAVAYILLCKFNYDYHNQARFQTYLPNRKYISYKIRHGFWEKYELSFDSKTFKILKKKKDWAPLIAGSKRYSLWERKDTVKNYLQK